MRTIGVTGGIGSGKTTVCRMLEALGARVFYADEEARHLLVDDHAARAEMIDAFGEDSYLDDGSLNRGYLARHVFADPSRVERINAIVHPRVFERFEQIRRKAEEDGVKLLVKEAALIFETGAERDLDGVVVVDAPETLRIRRVMERDAVMEEDVRARMTHQLPSSELVRRADYVIDNSGDVDELRSIVEALYREVTGR